MTSLGRRLRDWARRIKRELAVVAAAARDPRTPLVARIVAVLVVAYALSPIDLIPDFIPVLGLLDDVILVPLGLLLVIRLIPAEILDEHRRRIDAGRLPPNRVAAAFILALWLGAFGLLTWWLVGKAL